MTRTRWTLRDVESGALDWRTLLHFVQHLGTDSALWRSVNPDRCDLADWRGGVDTADVLANIYDAVAVISAQLATKPGSRVKLPKPHPRPGADGKRHIGKGAVKASEIKKTYYSL